MFKSAMSAPRGMGLFVLILSSWALVAARLAGECAMLCNDLRNEVLTPEMCREAKRTLPRPKVGDFCSNAMEQGFSDACVSLCMEQRPVVRVAQTCRAAAVEMPRPTVRKWCEHGYNVAFSKTTEDLATHFKPDRREEEVQEEILETLNEEPPAEASATVPEPEVAAAPQIPAEETPAADSAIIARIPVTIAGKDLSLLLHEGESAEDAVVTFCKDNVKDDVSACIRQMLPEVLERLEEGGSSGGLRGSA